MVCGVLTAERRLEPILGTEELHETVCSDWLINDISQGALTGSITTHALVQILT